MSQRGFSVLGDSISTLKGWVPDDWRIHYEGEARIAGIKRFEDTWWGKVIDHFDGRLVSNSSFSGSTMEGFGFPAGCSDKRINHLIAEDGTKPNVVLIYLGINDYGWGGARNQVMGRSVSASAKPEDLPGPKEVIGIADEDALQRFEDAYRQAVEKIQALAPEAEIWCLNHAPGAVPGAPWPNFAYRIRGIELDDYNKAIARVCQQTGAHLADIRGFGINYDSVDGTHPSALGMQQLADMVIQQMEGKDKDASAIPSLANAPKSVRTCFKDSCDGCPYIDIEPHRWSLYCSENDPK